MELVKKGGVKVEDRKPLGPPLQAPGQEGHKHETPPAEKKIYVCDVHPEEVFDKPGRCKKES